MQITGVEIWPVDEAKVKAYAAIVMDGCFVIKDLKIIDTKDKIFVAMPSKRRRDGTFRDTAHPLDMATRQMLESAVLAAYAAKMNTPTP